MYAAAFFARSDLVTANVVERVLGQPNTREDERGSGRRGTPSLEQQLDEGALGIPQMQAQAYRAADLALQNGDGDLVTVSTHVNQRMSALAR